MSYLVIRDWEKGKNMKILKRCYNLWQNYIRRFRTGKKIRVVHTYIDERPGVKTTDLIVNHHSPPEVTGESAYEINRLDQHQENNSDNNGIPILPIRENFNLRTNQDIDSTGFDSLEDYAEKISMSEETIVKWVNAGILSPRETEEAEKIIRILRLKSQKSQSIDTHSSNDT